MEVLESYLANGVSVLRLAVETIGAVVIAVGVGGVLVRWIRGRLGAAPRLSFRGARLHLSQYLAMALELQLAGDILSTAIAPSWAALGKLAAIAGIRTFLNYFLERDVRTLSETRDPSTRPASVAEPAPA